MRLSLLLPLVVLAVAASIWLRAWLLRGRLEFRLRLLQLLGLACERGQPVTPLIAAAEREHTGGRRRALTALRTALESGDSLAAALGTAGRPWFDADVVHSVEAAEGTGRIGATLTALADEHALELHARHRLGLALLYPTLLVLLVVGLHGYVQTMLGWAIRAPTADSFAALWLGVGAVVAWVLSKLLRTYDLWPGARALASARLLRLTSILAGAGVRVPDALRRAARACRRRSVRDAAGEIADRLEAGERSSDTWQPLGLPPALTLRMGALDSRPVTEALTDLTHRLALRARQRRERFLRWLQPASILLVAAIVLFEYSVLIGILGHAQDTVQLW